jgi:hypothetical protein
MAAASKKQQQINVDYYGEIILKKIFFKNFDLVEPRLMKKGHWMFLNNIFSYLTSKLEIQDGCHMHANQLITILHSIY